MDKSQILKECICKHIEQPLPDNHTLESYYEMLVGTDEVKRLLSTMHEAMDTYAASLIAEKEREWKDKLLDAFEDGIEAGKDSTFYGCEYDYKNEQILRADFKEKHNL